jgi:hypothetical protein
MKNGGWYINIFLASALVAGPPHEFFNYGTVNNFEPLLYSRIYNHCIMNSNYHDCNRRDKIEY